MIKRVTYVAGEGPVSVWREPYRCYRDLLLAARAAPMLANHTAMLPDHWYLNLQRPPYLPPIPVGAFPGAFDHSVYSILESLFGPPSCPFCNR